MRCAGAVWYTVSAMASGTRSELRIGDLMKRQPSNGRMMNVKVPLHQWEGIRKLAGRARTSKTEVVIALLLAGLEMAGKLKR